METYNVIGLMSGTSLDGLDIINCEFYFKNNHWTFKILHSDCIPLSKEWVRKLKFDVFESSYDLCQIDAQFGKFIGEEVANFIDKHKIIPDFAASHGYTVYHEPESGFTTQIGSGAAISAIAHIPVVCDFRSCDVAVGGLGAPIVPLGDVHLFEEYSFCINLGGIANISCRLPNEKMIGSDICPANIVLNGHANFLGLDYDKDGNIGRGGKLSKALLNDLNKIDYYKKTFPKTLEALWIKDVYEPILRKHDLTVADKLRTTYEHIGMQIGKTVNTLNVQGISNSGNNKVLLSGGGALNSFLVECIDKYCPIELDIPRPEIIEYKEALIMAFLGVLRFRNEENCLGSVTGARLNSIGGAIYRGTSAKKIS